MPPVLFRGQDVSREKEMAPQSSLDMIESGHGNPENIQPDHVRLVLNFPPKYSIAKVVQIIKSNTRKPMWEKFDFLRQRYYGRGGICSAGYFASTVDLDEKLIERYGRYQEKEDLGQPPPTAPK